MKIGSLFDGIGGFPLVASWYGITAAWASEIEAAPINITKRHFPHMKHLGDITKVNGAEIEPVDIITFGSPCQDLSVAGKRAGLKGARSGLFGEAIRIIEEMREATNERYPTWAIWENVPGAYSSNDGLDFRAVLQSFTNTEIPMPASGRWADGGLVRGGKCDVGWRTLDAQFWGVPQRRKRIFLVADFGGQRAAEVLFKPESMQGHFAPSRTPGQRAAADAESGAVWPSVARTLAARHDSSPCADRGQNFVYDRRGNGDGETVNTLTGDHQNRVTDYMAIVAFTANDHGNDVGTVSPTLRCGGGCGVNGGVVPAVCVAPFDTTQITSKQNASRFEYGAPCHTLNANAHVPAVAFGIKSFGEYEETDVGKTLLSCDDVTTGDLVATVDCRNLVENENISGTLQAKSGGGYSLNYQNTVREGGTVRRLTPVECERLQGYPDNWTALGHNSKPISDSARYKAIGNSLALPCVEYLIAGIKQIDDMMQAGA